MLALEGRVAPPFAARISLRGACMMKPGGLLNDAPVQVPSAVLLAIFALILVASWILVRRGGPQPRGEGPPRRIRWLARSEQPTAT